MKRFCVVLVLSFIVYLPSYVTANVNHEISISPSAAFGLWDSEEEDGILFEYGSALKYTYFFQPLDDEDISIDLREYLIHPSKLSVGGSYLQFYREGGDYYISDYESQSTRYGIEGRGYLPSNTGIGGAVFRREKEWEGEYTDGEIEYTYYVISVDQYIGKSHNILLSYNRQEREYSTSSTELTENVIMAEWKSVFGRAFQLNLALGFGDRERGDQRTWDIIKYKLELGHYIGHKFSLIYGVNGANYSSDETTSGLSVDMQDVKLYLSPRIWFSEHFLWAIEPFYNIYIEKTYYSGGSSDWTESETGLKMTFSIRF